MANESDRDFESFTQEDWTAYAWDLLKYPADRLTLDDVMDESADTDMNDLRAGRPTHTEDSRFDHIRSESYESDSIDDPMTLLFEIYSLKEYIEESPHPESTNVRRLGNLLQRMYTEYGIVPSDANSGELIERVISR